MSTNTTNDRSDEMRDPSQDRYLEPEKGLGAAEDALAADIAAGRKAPNDGMGAIFGRGPIADQYGRDSEADTGDPA